MDVDIAIAELFPCLPEGEQRLMQALGDAYGTATHVIPTAVYDAIVIAVGMAGETMRLTAFNATYNLVRVTGLPFPPPLDDMVYYDTTIWDKIKAYALTGWVYDRAECDVLAFKGNQGGAWPVLWP